MIAHPSQLDNNALLTTTELVDAVAALRADYRAAISWTSSLPAADRRHTFANCHRRRR